MKGFELSERELAVAIAVAEGELSKQIADRLGITEHEVEKVRQRIAKKLSVNGAVGIVHYALAVGIVENKFLRS